MESMSKNMSLGHTQENTVQHWAGRFLQFVFNFHNRTVLFSSGRIIFVTYGLIAATAFLVGTIAAVGYSRMVDQDPWALLRFSSLFLLPSVLIGARAFSILLEWKNLFINPLKTLLKPGYMLHGGVLGGAIAIVAYSLTREASIFALTDAWVFALPIGEGIARIGCHSYGCCWGKPTHGNFGITYSNPDSKVVRCVPHLKGKRLYPVQLFGSAAHFLQFSLLLIALPWIPYQGMLTGLYLSTHPVIRIGLERFRQDDRGHLFGPFTHTNLYSAIQFIIGLVLLVGTSRLGNPVSPDFKLLFATYSMEPQMLGYMALNFTFAALAFGVHVDKVGSWYREKTGSIKVRNGFQLKLATVKVDTPRGRATCGGGHNVE